ncbi:MULTISPECIES: hypothetical protein [Gordonia]|uniref:Uncharacterized protein n=1 Tax=Gordonia sihwensis NBRC 108236 TaxID=1223544 RepID=L7LMM7_9ACTN|nr:MULTISPECIES: hypothetical protein [Gordonia]GAC62395.1 hypothetical protein GSI01S_34_00070 [Gordonia sihwensis NBRC 108236]
MKPIRCSFTCATVEPLIDVMKANHFERERAAALRDTTSRHDTLRGRWSAWVRWALEDRVRRADLAAGFGGSSATPSKPPPRPWRSKPLRDDPKHQNRQADPDGIGWAAAAVARGVGRTVLTVLLVPGLLIVGSWWIVVPRVGPVRPRILALAGIGLAMVAATAVALLKPLDAVEAAATLPWLWLGVSMIAAASIAHDVLGWRPPITGNTATTTPDSADGPLITLDDPDTDHPEAA